VTALVPGVAVCYRSRSASDGPGHEVVRRMAPRSLALGVPKDRLDCHHPPEEEYRLANT
jgi:hypothetical protein